ncbi:aminotransferase class IV family protein [Actinomadura sp. DC4]|uniref:aminotransferase class IV family protein n=1 Tax=Actinomadura sp. DC4 TaxID=3055069 RepID=UPI0025B248BA|nr:aminotransferase class IV family protein [Actinomadura sp. DC4]MDN3353878.1 aminotransferase class IV family protein [Actinomadura sp. DC4]
MTALPRIEINGHPATAEELARPAVVNYGHFTVMQVRGGRTRGMDLHLARLDAAGNVLFGAGIDAVLVRDRIRHALGDTPDAGVRVSVFWPAGDDAPSIMVVVRPPDDPPSSPQSLQTAIYQRPVPQVKHAGTFGQIYYGRRAERAGFDDALLVDADGVISEGSVTNLGCYDGGSVIWPDAPALDGITMQLLEQALPARGVPSRRGPVRIADLESCEAVFVTNSRGVAAVGRVNELRLPVSEEFMKTVTEAYESVPWDLI